MVFVPTRGSTVSSTWPVLERGQCLKSKSLGNKIQFLLKLQCRHYRAPEIILIAGCKLCHRILLLSRFQAVIHTPLDMCSNTVVREIDRSFHRTCIDSSRKQIVHTDVGLLRFSQLHIQAQRKTWILTQICINVILKWITHHINVIIIGEKVFGTILNHTCLVIDRDTWEIIHSFAASPDINIEILVKCLILKKLVIPVDIRISIRI